jgi:bifunctional DNA-binding transcriptional regulator/antitoxin component of YhaV-PrlF toxin-antitoxin module
MKPMILSKRFEVTIPKQVRDSLRLRVGQKFEIKTIGSLITLASKTTSGSFTKTTYGFCGNFNEKDRK